QYDEAFDVNELKLETKHNAGFVAGTLVHTDKGLVPIQNIKVGDLVLSMPDDALSAEEAYKYLAYKPVTKVFKSQDMKPIMLPIDSAIFCTDKHPFWTQSNGWVEARYLDKDTHKVYTLGRDGIPEYIESSYYANRNHFKMAGKYVIATRDSQIAVVLYDNFFDDGISVMQPSLWKFESDKYVPILTNDKDSYLGKFDDFEVLDSTYFKGIFLDKSQDKEMIAYYSELLKEVVEGNAYPFCQYVFNIEVADYHTYFVGEQGLWVHNCDTEPTYSNNLTVEQIQTLVPLLDSVPNHTCFPAGTRVMTDKGLVPIENIQVGDKVLSKPEDNTGEAEFKPVLKKFVHDNKELWMLTYVEIPSNTDRNKLTTDKLKCLSKRGKFTTIKATPNHPFWVEKESWTRLDHLQYGHIIQSKKDGMVCMVFNVSPMLQTNIESVAAQSSIRNILDADKKGEDIDDVTYYNFAKYGNDGYVAEFLNDGHDSPSPLNVEGYPPIEVSTETYRTTVYNFEVADHHTYYVWDLWVHNCDTK
ncbi:polymorphic toxin-type HINT domain-containing protein, partial [Moraxella oblonga]|uniref:polymorphic toxin-type HINT domain-containing protein n=1 Tax=Moraxella oblonga TaxID=200413 RepID=UPI00082D951D